MQAILTLKMSKDKLSEKNIENLIDKIFREYFSKIEGIFLKLNK